MTSVSSLLSKNKRNNSERIDVTDIVVVFKKTSVMVQHSLNWKRPHQPHQMSKWWTCHCEYNVMIKVVTFLRTLFKYLK